MLVALVDESTGLNLLIETTFGGVWSMVYVRPFVKPPLIVLPTLSTIPVSLSLRSKRKVPSPLIELTVTLNQPLAIWVTEEILPVVAPVVVNVKSFTSTPLTLLLNITR